MIEFDRILNGEKPSFIFREILMKNPDLEKDNIGPMIVDHFSGIDSIVVNHIWQWKIDDKSYGCIDDDWLNEDILTELTKAGYFILR